MSPTPPPRSQPPPPPGPSVPRPPAPARLGRALLDLVLPAECAVCAAPGTRLCPSCRDALVRALGRPRRGEAGACSLPLGPHGDPLPVMLAGAYEPPVSTALLAFKDHHALHLRGLLAGALARAVAAMRREPDVPGAGRALLVPVPGSASGYRRRGYDPLEELCRALDPVGLRRDLVRAPRLGSLRGADGARSHAGAGARARRRRSRGWRVRAGRVAPGTPVLLLDDVLTTGATLAALHAAVRRAGAVPVGAVVVAGVRPPAADGGDVDHADPGLRRGPRLP